MTRNGIPYETSANAVMRAIAGRSVAAVKLLSELQATDGDDWTWGRFQYVTNKMISEGKLFHARDPEGNKLLSNEPIEEQPVKPSEPVDFKEIIDICLVQNEIMMSIAGGTLLDYKTRLEKIGVTDVVDDVMLERNKIGTFLIEKALRDLNVNPETIAAINKKLHEIAGDKK